MIPKKNRRLPLRRFTRRRNVNGNSTRRRTILSRFGRSRSTRRTNYTGRRRTGFKRRRTVSRKSPVTQVLKHLFPINRFTYVTAQQEQVTAASSTTLRCQWFCPLRAADVSISYPNWTDASDIAATINRSDVSDALENPTGSEIGSNDPRFYTMNFQQSCKIVNNSNAQCCIEAYVCTARRDIPMFSIPPAFENTFNFLNLLGHGFVTSNVQNDAQTGLPVLNPETSMITGFFGKGALQMNDAARTPYDSTTFTRLFKVSSVPKRILNAGDISVFNLSHKSKITNTASQYKTLFAPTSTWRYNGNVDELASVAPKGAKFFLFKLTGQPAHIPGETSTLVKYTNPKIDMVTTVQFSYQYIRPTGRYTYRSSNYGIQEGNQPTSIINEATATPVAFVNV